MPSSLDEMALLMALLLVSWVEVTNCRLVSKSWILASS